MNETDYFLETAAEECCEVAKDISKALRFGLDDKVTLDPHGPRGTTGPTNRERVVEELNDLLGVVGLLVSKGILPPDWADPIKQRKKAEKVLSYLDYAKRVGAVQK